MCAQGYHERDLKRSGIRKPGIGNPIFAVCKHCKSLYDTGELADLLVYEETAEVRLIKAHEVLASLDSRGGLGSQAHEAIRGFRYIR